MKNKAFKAIVLLLMGAMTLTAFQCGKEEEEPEQMILGHWVNTAQSYETTIAGQEFIPEGCIGMEFTADYSVKIVDSRLNCLPEWQRYTLYEDNGRQLLVIENGCHAGVFLVLQLTSDQLVLAPETSNIDWDFRYIMKR